MNEQPQWLGRVVRAGRRFPQSEPPPLVSQRLRRIPARNRQPGPEPTELLLRPSLLPGRPSATRGTPGGRAPRRQSVFAAEGFEVVLDVQILEGGDRTLRGQVIPSEDTPPVFQVAVVTPTRRLISILGDRFGGFEVHGVPADSIRVELTNDLVVLVIPLDETVSVE